MCDSSEEFVRLGDSLARNRNSDDGSSIPGEVETGPSDSDLLRILECPVCTEFPSPPIFNCAKGHFTCNDCILLLRECTLCQSPFTQVRNYALESIIERTKFKCKYANLGCPETPGGTGGEYQRHLDTCQYGPLLCNEKVTTVCDRVPVDPENYLEHLFSCHDAVGKYVPDSYVLSGDFVQKKGDLFPPIYLKSEKSQLTFLLNTKKYKSFICWWVTCLDTQEVGNYQAQLTWSKKAVPPEAGETSECGLQWTLPVHSIKKSFDAIRDSGLCSVVPDTHLIPFMSLPESEESEEGTWNIRVEIIKKGQPVATQENDSIYLNQLLKAYFPLITTVFMIFALTLLFGIYSNRSSESSMKGRVVNGQGSDDYYGYRGFYYHPDVDKPDNEFEHSETRGRKGGMDNRQRKHEKEPDDYYVGYGGFYYKKDKANNGDSGSREKPESIFKRFLCKLLGVKSWKSLYQTDSGTDFVFLFDLVTRFSAVFLTFVLILTSVYYCNFSNWTL